MTAEPQGTRVPTTDVVAPQGLWQFVFKRLLLVAAIALVMVWAIGNTHKGMIEAISFLALIIVLAAVEIPLLQHRWNRQEQQRLETLPPGVLYAGPARVESDSANSHERPVPGELVLDDKGISFTPKRVGQAALMSLAWSDMRHIDLHPMSGAPLAGSLILTLARGSTHRFVVQRCTSLADVLLHLSERI